jgi:alanine racemase
VSGAAVPELTVDLDALAANYARLAEAARGAEVAPVVKADGYGVGLGPVADRLWREGGRRFFVARIDEGVALRQRLPGAQIYVLDGGAGAETADLVDRDLLPVLNDLEQVDAWRAEAARRGQPLKAALQVDTGLNRLGLDASQAQALAGAPERLAGVAVALVLSHLACADDPDHPMNARQAERFAALAALFPNARTSLAATAGIFLGPAYHGAVVRPGIGLYGAGAPGQGLSPVAILDAPIVQVREIAPGETVGYGAGFTAAGPTRVAILGIGYADGVLRAQGGAGYGWFAGAKRPLLGRISMDLTALDVTGCDAEPGQRVELFGANLPVDEAAARAGTAPYELLTRIGPRVRRRYLGRGASA